VFSTILLVIVLISSGKVDIDENCLSSETPSACVERLAKQKARAGLQEMPDAIVIGSDTMVVVDEHVMGKPRNREDAVQMLELLSGRSHEVFSAVAVANTEQQAGKIIGEDFNDRKKT